MAVLGAPRRPQKNDADPGETRPISSRRLSGDKRRDVDNDGARRVCAAASTPAKRRSLDSMRNDIRRFIDSIYRFVVNGANE